MHGLTGHARPRKALRRMGLGPWNWSRATKPVRPLTRVHWFKFCGRKGARAHPERIHPKAPSLTPNVPRRRIGIKGPTRSPRPLERKRR